MTDRTYLHTLTEQDIKDIASSRASRKVMKRIKIYLIGGTILVILSSIIAFTLNTSFTPIGGTLTALIVFLYVWMAIQQIRFTKEITKEFISEL